MFELKEISDSFIRLDCAKRFTMQNMLKDSGVYFGQPPILEYIDEKGACTQNELAKALGVSPASIAVSVKRMQKSGLIEKITDDNDLRCNRISTTEKGKRLTKEIHSKFDLVDRMAYAGFSNEELVELKMYLDRICNNLNFESNEKICSMLMKGNGGSKE